MTLASRPCHGPGALAKVETAIRKDRARHFIILNRAYTGWLLHHQPIMGLFDGICHAGDLKGKRLELDPPAGQHRRTDPSAPHRRKSADAQTAVTLTRSRDKMQGSTERILSLL